MSLIDKSLAADVIDAALSTGGDFAEIFVENTKNEGIFLSERQVKDINSTQISGVGIRVFCGDFQTYAYTNVWDRENLLNTAKKAAQAVKSSNKINCLDFRNLDFEKQYAVKNNPFNVAKSEKITFMHSLSDMAYAKSSLIDKVSVNINSKNREILVANSEGVWAEDVQMYSGIMFDVQALRDGISDSVLNIHRAMQGYELYDNIPQGINAFVEDTVERAIAKTYAKNCPCGVMPIVLASGFGGVIFHEACGHSLEANHIAANSSEFCGKMGQIVASPVVTAYDDSLVYEAHGSSGFDDEGTPTQRRLLIENGVLKNYLTDKFYGKKIGLSSNGAARRENYTYIPVPRMSNTFIAAGKSTKDDILAATDYGLYAKHFKGGSVNTTTGEFNFAISEGYIIRNGKIAEQVKGARLIGKGIDVLKKIDMVGNDFKLQSGICGASSGRVPVTSGQPTIRVTEMTVGG